MVAYFFRQQCNTTQITPQALGKQCLNVDLAIR
jgi:hypothetical protein